MLLVRESMHKAGSRWCAAVRPLHLRQPPLLGCASTATAPPHSASPSAARCLPVSFSPLLPPTQPPLSPLRCSLAEFAQIAQATSVGFLIMGFIGLFVKLIFIPINGIIMSA